MRIALVHDDLVQWGGAERILEALSQLFPDAPIYTSVFDSTHPILSQKFNKKLIYTSFIQQIPGWRIGYRSLLPLYPIAFEQFDFSDFDLVISQTTRFAKSILTKPQTIHYCYCHTPPRFLWNLSGEKPLSLLKPYFNFLKQYDLISASRVDHWIAGSKNAKLRIKDIYQTDCEVIYPFVDFTNIDVPIFQGGYLLVVSRLNYYKRVDLVIKAANQLKMSLKIVGCGVADSYLKSIAGPTVQFIGICSEELLQRLIAGCQVLVLAGEEDFGLTPLEAQYFGKPVIAYKKGGALETIKPGITGYLFDSQTVESLLGALLMLQKYGYNEKACVQNAKLFSKERFIDSFRNLLKKYE